MSEIPGFYPVFLRESRYSGVYSHGRWVLIAGCYDPKKTDAFAGDIPCMEFWQRVREEGPVIEIEGPHETQEVYVASGDDPNQLIEEARDYVSDESEFFCLDCLTEYEGTEPVTCSVCGSTDIEEL